MSLSQFSISISISMPCHMSCPMIQFYGPTNLDLISIRNNVCDTRGRIQLSLGEGKKTQPINKHPMTMTELHPSIHPSIFIEDQPACTAWHAESTSTLDPSYHSHSHSHSHSHDIILPLWCSKFLHCCFLLVPDRSNTTYSAMKQVATIFPSV